MASVGLVLSCCLWFHLVGILSSLNIRPVPVGNKLNHIQSTIMEMLGNISKYCKLNENMILNDFDEPYIVIVFAS